MTKLPTPEQWVLSRMDEMECAEMIEQHIDFYVESKDGFRRSVHLPTQFVRHYLQRHDGALPTVVAIATAPLVLADGALLAPDGLDRDRGIVFIIPKELRAIIPRAQGLHAEAVKAAMEFLMRRVAVRRRHRLRRQVHHHCCRAHPDRALAAAGPAALLRHRRATRRRQDHDAHHADHGGHWTVAGGGGVVDQRGGAAQGADELLPVRRAVHPVGQHRARHADHRARTSRRAAPPRTTPTASSA